MCRAIERTATVRFESWQESELDHYDFELTLNNNLIVAKKEGHRFRFAKNRKPLQAISVLSKKRVDFYNSAVAQIFGDKWVPYHKKGVDHVLAYACSAFMIPAIQMDLMPSALTDGEHWKKLLSCFCSSCITTKKPVMISLDWFSSTLEMDG